MFDGYLLPGMGRQWGTDVKMSLLACHLISSLVMAGLWQAPVLWIEWFSPSSVSGNVVVVFNVLYWCGESNNQEIVSVQESQVALSKDRRNEKSVNFVALLFLFRVSLCDPRWLVIGLPPLPTCWDCKCIPPMSLWQKASTTSAIKLWLQRSVMRGKPDSSLGPHRHLKFSHQIQAQRVTNKY